MNDNPLDKLKQTWLWTIVAIASGSIIGVYNVLNSSKGIQDLLNPRLPGSFQVETQTRPPWNTWNTIEKLKRIEGQQSIRYEKHGPKRFNTFPEYYLGANKDTLTSLEPRKNSSNLHFIMAEAGAGKTFLVQQLKSSKSINIVKIELSKIIPRDNLNPALFELKPDLENDNSIHTLPPLSALPSLKKGVPFGISYLYHQADGKIENKQKNVVIVDGVDEMHPELAKRIINIFVDEAETPHIHGIDSGNVSIVLFGRPEGFRDYNIDPRRRKTSDLQVHELKPPTFRSRNDILILIKNFNSYFRSKQVNVSTFINRLESVVDKFDFLLPAFGNLSHSNMLVQEIDAGQLSSEHDLKLRLFNSLLERNHESHGRPTKDKEIYKKLLQAIARDYASKVDDEGYFQVNSQDMIKGTYLNNDKVDQIFSFNVISVLSRSGLVYMNPNDFYNPKFQFRPFWLHRFLVENSDI